MLTVTDGKPRQPYRLIVNNEKDRSGEFGAKEPAIRRRDI
jgi:hypothetical protein